MNKKSKSIIKEDVKFLKNLVKQSKKFDTPPEFVSFLKKKIDEIDIPPADVTIYNGKYYFREDIVELAYHLYMLGYADIEIKSVNSNKYLAIMFNDPKRMGKPHIDGKFLGYSLYAFAQEDGLLNYDYWYVFP